MATATVAQPTSSSSISYTQVYQYDGQDQLTSVDGSGDSGSYTYAYDGVGNRTGTSMGTANSLNQYSNFTYNARGDVTQDGTYAYSWNAADQLIAVTADDNSVKVAYAYDGEGRRIEKDVFAYEAGDWSLQSTRKFVYDGTNLVEETDGSGNPITGYTWGPQGLMAVTDFTGTTPKVYLAMLDGQGNVVGLADAGTGAVVASYTYDPYGALLSATGPAAGVCNIRYKQSYMDVETKSNHFEDRDELWIGIWDKRDPAGIAGGSNVFIFCDDDPINKTDPTGDTPQWVTKAINGWNSFIDPINDYDAKVRESMRTIGFVNTWNVIMDHANDTSDKIVDSAVHLPTTIGKAQDATAMAMGHILTVDQAANGNFSGGNLAKGASYVVLSILGPKDIGEASFNVDLESGELLDPSGRWNEARIVRMSSGVSQTAFTGAGIRGGYNNNLKSFSLAPVKYPKFLVALRRSSPSAAPANINPVGALEDWENGAMAADRLAARDLAWETDNVNVQHGNSALSRRTAYLYRLIGQDGTFLKWGITQNMATRYPKSFMLDKNIFEYARGNRAEMLVLERNLVETQPGPLNREPWAGSKNGGRR